MAERIKIFELDIDVDGAITASKQLNSEAISLKKRLDDLKDAGETNSREFVELEARYKSVRSEYGASQRELGKLIDLQGKEVKTVAQARNALSVVGRQWAKQADLYGENSVEADKLAKKKLELTERLKVLEKQTGDNTRNVGNYAEGMREALGQSTLLGQATETVASAMAIVTPVIDAVKTEVRQVSVQYKAARVEAQTFSGSQKAVAVATNLTSTALKLLKIALIATGIGAIVVVLGSLVAMFTRTQKGIDFVNTALAAMGAFFDVIIDRASQLGGALMKLVTGDIKGGIKDITSTFKGMGDEIAREIQLAMDLERVLQGVEKAEINLDIRRAAANSRLKELKKLSEDASKSTADRIKASEDFAKIEEGLVAEEVANQEKRVAAMLGFAEVTDEVRETIKKIGQEGVSLDQLGISESTIEDMKLFKDEAVKLYDLQSASYERQTENQNKLNTLLNEQKAKEKAAADAARAAQEERIAAAKAATEAAISESKTRLEIFIEENEGKAKSLAESIAVEEQVRDKRLLILQEELEAKKLTQSEYELAILQTKNDFLDEQAALTKEYADKELEAKLERDAKLKEIELLKKEQEAVDLENKMAIDEENFGARMELERERLEMMRQQEIAEAEKTGADVTLINKKYAVAQEQITKNLEETKRAMRSQTLGMIKNLLGEESALGKAFALAEIANNTVKEATKAFNQAAVFFSNPLTASLGVNAAIQGGIILATGAAQAAKIVSPKLEEGGLMKIGGKRHSAGGTKFYGEDGTTFEAEQGELIGVVNRRAAAMVQGLNDAYPVNGMRAANYMAAGGFITKGTQVTNMSGNSIDYDLLAQKLGAQIQLLPAPQVAVTEINSVQGRYAKVVDGANF